MEAPSPPAVAASTAPAPLRTRPAPPHSAHEAVTAVEAGRRTTPQLAPELAVPTSPAPAPGIQSRLLRTASRSVKLAVLRAFPPALCVLVRVGGNAGTRAMPCACARADGAPCRESGVGATGRPAPGRHFVLRRARGLRVMDARKPGQQRPERRGCADCTSLRCPEEDGAERLQLSPSMEGSGLLYLLQKGLRACTRSGMPKLLFVSGMHEPVGFHTFLCARPRRCIHIQVCEHSCLHCLATYTGPMCMDSVLARVWDVHRHICS